MINKTKIGINGFFLNKPNTGIGKYTRDVILNAAKIAKDIDFILYVNVDTTVFTKKDSQFYIELPYNIQIKHVFMIGFGTAGIKKTIWEQKSLLTSVKSDNCDAIIMPYPAHPWCKKWYKNGIYTISMIHDCIPWKDKDYQVKFLSKLYNKMVKKSSSLVDEIWTVSETSKKDIVELFKISKEKIRVFYNCVSREYMHKYTKGISEKVLKKFRLVKDGYFLYVGGYDPRKNVKKLVLGFEKYQKLTKDGTKKIPLVLCGGKILKLKYYSDFDSIKSNDIVKTGFVSNEELAILYQNACGYFTASKDEGFNIPSIEALFSNCPIYLSDIDVHHEIIGKVANFIDISSPDTISKAFHLCESQNNICINDRFKCDTGERSIEKIKSVAKHKKELMIKYTCKNASGAVQARISAINQIINNNE